MKIIFFLVFFLIFKNVLFAPVLFSQNIVPNPSFEEIKDLPNDMAQFYLSKYWFNVTSEGTPDIYHAQAMPYARLPMPTWAYTHTYPHTGEACAGIVGNTTTGFQEYIGVKLSKKIKKGDFVKVQFYYTNGKDNIIGGLKTKLGVYFSNEKILKNTSKRLAYTPHLESENALFSTDWQLFQKSFCAEEDFEFLYIGNFSENPPIITHHKSIFKDWAYYFIDDVKIMVNDE